MSYKALLSILFKSALASILSLLACHAVLGNTVVPKMDKPTALVTSAVEDSAVLDRILAYFPMDTVGLSAGSCLNGSSDKSFLTRRFALEGKCKSLDDESQACAYRDYRKLDLSKLTGFDQRGIYSYQVTFPGTEHLYAALSVNNEPGSQFCWVGGAQVGQNPLAITWGGETGTKGRKNNFILSESGLVRVEGARIHNLHDVFLASGPEAGFNIQDSWISWNRDDLFEGYLQNLRITDTLVDGTYTFISDPDGECDDDKRASHSNVVIEDSLIRLQRLPGPFARHTSKWHWAVEGGHNTLWKLDSCDWDEWPTFSLKNNVFLIEGPRTTFKELNKIDCRLALPGDCENSSLSNLKDCHNNLFMYSQYHHWRKAGAEPGPVPQTGNRFYNPANAAYLPNGMDCYQKLTDDVFSEGFADVEAIWKALRQQWIDKHTAPSSSESALMMIPGIDFHIFESGSTLRIVNRKTGECLGTATEGLVQMQECIDSKQQLFTVESFDDGKLSAGILLRNSEGGYLRSDWGKAFENIKDSKPLVSVVSKGTGKDGPAFSERWYILPLPRNTNAEGFYYIESDALQRTFLRQDGKTAHIQTLFADGVMTALPQERFSGGNDHSLQWDLREVE